MAGMSLERSCYQLHALEACAQWIELRPFSLDWQVPLTRNTYQDSNQVVVVPQLEHISSVGLLEPALYEPLSGSVAGLYCLAALPLPTLFGWYLEVLVPAS